MRTAPLAAALALAALGPACARMRAQGGAEQATDAKPAQFRPEDAPAPLAPAIRRADAAIRTFRDRLLAHVAADMSRGGPREALRACMDGPELAAEVSAQTGVAVGRASARPGGARSPRGWVARIAGETAGRRAADVQAVAVDLGDRVGVLRPIAIASPCLACHGGPERVAPDVQAAMDAARAPERATAYAEGDLGGYFWAEAKK